MRAMFAAILALLAAFGGALLARDASGASPGKNIVLILTDDMTTADLAAMPNVQSLIAAQGTTFNHAYASFPICCPSRATLLSGQYMHNHGVRGNLPPFGGWTRFVPHEDSALPVRLKGYGYYTAHIGKYMNFYAAENNASLDSSLPVPPGWDEWYGKVSDEALYFNYQMIEKTSEDDPPRLTFYGDQASDYQTDVFRDRAVDFINDLDTGTQTPFLMNLWFNSPHGPFDPAPRDLFRRAGVPLPKLPGFNEKDISDKPKWFRKQARKRLSKRQAKVIANERRRQQEQLLSVDQAVAELVASLSAKGILDETYLVFTSDNGFFRGEHRISAGKFLPHDPSSRVPLIIRGPDVPRGGVSSEIVWLGDLPQTFLQIASGADSPGLDGRSLLPFAEDPTRRSSRPILLEGDTGSGGAEAESARAGVARARAAKAGLAGRRGVKGLDQEPNAIKSQSVVRRAPAYRAIRTDRYLFVLYSNGQAELYDMKGDPAQLRSLVGNKRFRYVRRWLFDHLIALSGCAGASCRIELGPEPPPLPKSVLRPKRKKKGDGKDKGRPARNA
jgi:N-acetylglucosamine-6-sulfatase